MIHNDLTSERLIRYKQDSLGFNAFVWVLRSREIIPHPLFIGECSTFSALNFAQRVSLSRQRPKARNVFLKLLNHISTKKKKVLLKAEELN